MKILHVIESLEVGGAEMVVVQLANQMAISHDVSVCCVKKVGPLQERLSDRISVCCLHKKEGNDFRIPLAIASHVKAESFDVVHSHNWGVFFDSVLGARFGGARSIVHTAHGNFLPYPNSMSGKIKKHIRRAMDKFASFFLDELVTVSSYIRGQIIGFLGLDPKKISTIYNGIALNDFGRNVNSDQRQNNGEIVFTAVGRLASVKNYPMLIRAFAVAQEQTETKLKLWFVGDGPERKDLERLTTQLGIIDSVTFMGFKDNIKEILLDSDVFMLTSHYEGVSIALLEAMATGLPVIATSVGGNVEVVVDKQSGILIPDNDIKNCVAAMVKMANDEILRRDFGNNASERVGQIFNLDNTVHKYLAIYSRSN